MFISKRTRFVATLAAIVFGACAGPVDEADATSTSAAGVRASETPAAALARIQKVTGNAVSASQHKATGASRFLGIPQQAAAALGYGVARSATDKANVSAAFFREYGAAVGVQDPAGMRLHSTITDALGETHLTYKQFHGEVPVFGTAVKTHFDAVGRLKAVNGTAIPGLDVDLTPGIGVGLAGETARAVVETARGQGAGLRVGATTLMVFREGLAQGVPGDNHLAYEIEVTDDAGIRDLVYVSAHSGKVLDRIPGIHDALNRRAYDGKGLDAPPTNYPNGPFWVEGKPFPTPKEEANNMILASEETHRLFASAFGFDSFDGKGATMDMIFNRGYSCPNASWNGTFISFCPGFTTDDVTGHEWAHAYTQYTHSLIYQWQPGALNEAYSDIWGEIVDRLNTRGSDDNVMRRAGECSSYSPPITRVRINSPYEARYLAQAASFGGKHTTQGLTADIVAAIDAGDAAAGTNLDGCTDILNASDVAGKIALVNRGTCEFGVKALNAEKAGAIAVIVANNVSGLLVMGPGAVGSQVTIPAVSILQGDGQAIRAALAMSAVNGTVLAEEGRDVSYRWLMGEDVSDPEAPGALRDMWNPNCYSNPAKVSDVYYWCSTGDAGGVHINSGIPNHAFALLVDGGDYNGQTIAPIGMTRAAHLYFRAQTVYQVFDSDFADHATALEWSCADLTQAGALRGLDGNPSGQTMTDFDCQQVTKAIAAVEMRRTPGCAFTRNLAPNAVATCQVQMTTGVTTPIQSFTFDANDEGFTFSRSDTSPTFTPRDWVRMAYTAQATGRDGIGWFAATPRGSTCTDHDETGVLSLTSAEIVVPANAHFARATFDHWVGFEREWDGGNLKVSVNEGPWQFVPNSQFAFNGYHALLHTAADGNTNPMAGQQAWTGTTGGSATAGSWGRSLVNLGSFAKPGDRVRLRWDLGTDVCGGRDGWYMDTLSVFSCEPRVPELTVADVKLPEGTKGSTNFVFTVRMKPQPITGAPAGTPTGTIVPVMVKYEIVDGTATHGNDFDRIVDGGTLVIPGSTNNALFTSGTIAVSVKGDAEIEGDEQFYLRITEVTNATMADREAVATIVDDDAPPPAEPVATAP